MGTPPPRGLEQLYAPTTHIKRYYRYKCTPNADTPNRGESNAFGAIIDGSRLNIRCLSADPTARCRTVRGKPHTSPFSTLLWLRDRISRGLECAWSYNVRPFAGSLCRSFGGISAESRVYRCWSIDHEPCACAGIALSTRRDRGLRLEYFHPDKTPSIVNASKGEIERNWCNYRRQPVEYPLFERGSHCQMPYDERRAGRFPIQLAAAAPWSIPCCHVSGPGLRGSRSIPGLRAINFMILRPDRCYSVKNR